MNTPHSPALRLLLALALALPSLLQAATTAQRATQTLQVPAIQPITSTQLQNVHIVPTARLQEIQRFAAGEEAKVKRVLTKQDQSRVASLEKELRAILDIKDSKRRAGEITAYNKRINPFRTDLMKRAGVSDAAVLNKARQVFPEIQFVSRAGQIEGIRRTGLSAPSSTLPAVLNAGGGSGGNPDELTLTSFDERFERSGCVNQNDSSFGGDNFTLSQFSSYIAGCHSDLALGASFEVPSGVRRVHVEVEISGYRLRAQAVGILGYGQANADMGLRFSGPAFERFELDRSVVSIAPALLVLENQEEVSGSHFMTSSFEPRSNGGRYLAQVYGGLFTIGAANGFGSGIVAPENIRAFRIRFER